MFQRIKGAIDRTIETEQARQKGLLSDQGAPGHGRQSSSVSRSNSGASTAAGKRPRQKKPAPDDTGDTGTANPDPAVFEAAFVIDDDDEPSRTATPLPSSEDKKPDNGDSKDDDGGQDDKGKGNGGDTGAGNTAKDLAKNGGDDDQTPEGGPKPMPPPKPAAALELPPDVRAKLRKLEKLEATYPG